MIDIPDSVFPTNEQGEACCGQCHQGVSFCQCATMAVKTLSCEQIVARICKVKSGRRGKMVTLIEGLPAREAFLKKLTKRLKVGVGSGGTYYVGAGGGSIEIQGDQSTAILVILGQENIKVH